MKLFEKLQDPAFDLIDKCLEFRAEDEVIKARDYSSGSNKKYTWEKATFDVSEYQMLEVKLISPNEVIERQYED